MRADKKIDTGKNPAALTPGVRQLTEPASDPITEAERVEKARLARMAGQARESQVFFRLQLKAQPREATAAEVRPEPIPRPSPIAAEGDLTTLSALRAAERARAIAAGDLDGLANDNTSDQTRKLSFLKSGPEKDIYNPHGLQKPASPYQLMAGTIIAASMVSGLNSDLPGFVIAQVTWRPLPLVITVGGLRPKPKTSGTG